jgi:hypothetical protein
MSARKARPRRHRDGHRLRREPAALILGSPAMRERIAELVGEATIEAALRERHLIHELPASIWRQLLSVMERLVRMSVEEKKRFCAKQSEVVRRLLVLVVLDHDATMRVIQTKLG